MNVKVVLVAACALIDGDKRVLLAQRPPGKSLAGLWEFPGGKVEPGERPEMTLIRELKEEIGITVSEPCLAPLTFAEPGLSGFGWLSCGAQAESQMKSKVARMRPSASAKRSA